MLPENNEFMVRGEDGEEYGPVGLEELREWVRENRAGVGSLVRIDEPGSIWEPWQHFPELVALAAEAQVAGPLPSAEGITIAPLGRRFLAGIADVVISNILASPLLYLSGLDMTDLQNQLVQFYLQPQAPVPAHLFENLGLCFLIVYGTLTLYMAAFTAAQGRTPAKALMRLRVVAPGGGKPPFIRALARGIIFSFSICLYGLPLLYVFLNPNRRALHDYAADTCVVEA